MKKTSYNEYLACTKCKWASPELLSYPYSVCPKCGEKVQWQVGYFEYREVKYWWFWKIRDYIRFVKKGSE